MTIQSELLAKRALDRSKAHSIQVLDTATRYWSYPSSNPNAKVIIFIHGYRGNHHGLEAIAGALEDFHVIIPDLPGFGESTPFCRNPHHRTLCSLVSRIHRKARTQAKANSAGTQFRKYHLCGLRQPNRRN